MLSIAGYLGDGAGVTGRIVTRNEAIDAAQAEFGRLLTG